MPSLTLLELAQLTGARLEGDPTVRIHGPASLQDAESDQVSFLAEPRYRGLLDTTRAAAVIVPADLTFERQGVALLRTSDPQGAFNRVVMEFTPSTPAPVPGVHPTAVVEEGVELAEGCSVGALCFVGAGAKIAADVVLHPRVVVGAMAEVGRGTVLYPGVVLYPRVSLGAGCLVHGGAIIGSDGFGFEPTPEGWVKTPQGGTVVIEDDVEIGANVTIDRARFGVTRISSNVKIDNLVHVAHNCDLGRSAMFLAQSAVAGSTKVGKGVIVAGQAGLAGHLEIGDRARIGAKAAVLEDVPAGAEYWGIPAGPKKETIQRLKALERITAMRQEIKDLKRSLQEVQDRLK